MLPEKEMAPISPPKVARENSVIDMCDASDESLKSSTDAMAAAAPPP